MFTGFREFISSIDQKKKTNLLLVALLIGALGLTVVTTQQPTRSRQQAAEVTSPPFPPAGNISLALSTPNTQVSLNTEIPVDMYLEAGNQNITGLSFTILLTNNSVLVPKRVTLDSGIFNNQLRSELTQNSYLYAAVDTVGKPITGKVKLGTITLAAVKEGVSDFRFESVQATALGQEGLVGNQQNVNLQFTVVGTTTPTPTPIPPTPTSALPAACGTLYNKITAAFGTTCVRNDLKYDPVADLNKDKGVNGQDYSLFLKDTRDGTDSVACETFLGKTANPCTTAPIAGDANGDGNVDILDYNIWRDEYLGKLTTKTADFNKDGKIDLIDFSIWRNAFNTGGIG